MRHHGLWIAVTVAAVMLAAIPLALSQSPKPPLPQPINVQVECGSSSTGTQCEGEGVQYDTMDFPFQVGQTEEERYLKLAVIPYGLAVKSITLRNGVSPKDVDRVENTPRYDLYLAGDKLLGHVWLRPEGGYAPTLRLSLSISLLPYGDPQAYTVADPKLPIYGRELNKGCDHLHIFYDPKLMNVPSMPRRDGGFATALYVPC